MTRICLDTTVVVGLLDTKDIWHIPAVALQEALIRTQVEVTVFDCVLAEAVSILGRRLSEKRRVTELDSLLHDVLAQYPTDGIWWVLPDVPALYQEVVEMVRVSKGELNFNDALISLSCRNRGIALIASFDRDFDSIIWLKRVAQPEDLEQF
jgi:predicted nucleic acid-binding protein